MVSEIGVCPWCGSYYRGQTHCHRDGQELVEADGIVDRYRIVDRIGEGGMGAVYRAEHTLLGNRVVALKLLHREHTSDHALVNRFFREAKAASSVDNEHIAKVIDFGVTPAGEAFLVMEHVEGRGLRDVIDEEAPLSLERGFAIGVQIAEGLYAAHRQGIVHRDLKPENILLRTDGNGDAEFVKLLDFGIAQLSEYRDARITRAGMIIGTPAYMSPEQASGNPVDERADIYALGTILYEMLVGHCPFQGESAKAVLVAQLTKQPTPPRELRSDIPGAIERVILRTLNKDPDSRPKTMMYLAYELRDALAKQTGALPAFGSGPVDSFDDESLFRAHSGRLSPAALVARIKADVVRRPLLWAGGAVIGSMALGVLITLLLVSSGPAGNATVATPARDLGAGAAAVAPDSATPAVHVATPDAGPRVERVAPPQPPVALKKPRRPHRGSGTPRRTPPRTPPRTTEPRSKHAVRVVSTPSGAEVYDGRLYLGRTPLSVATDDGRRITVAKDGYQESILKLSAKQGGTVTARLRKDSSSWDVMSMAQLQRMRDSGQISRFTFDRRKRELLRKRDAKLIKLRIEHKMGHWTKEQYERQVKAIKDSYR